MAFMTTFSFLFCLLYRPVLSALCTPCPAPAYACCRSLALFLLCELTGTINFLAGINQYDHMMSRRDHAICSCLDLRLHCFICVSFLFNFRASNVYISRPKNTAIGPCCEAGKVSCLPDMTTTTTPTCAPSIEQLVPPSRPSAIPASDR